MAKALTKPRSGSTDLPALFAADRAATKRFIEFFTANIRNLKSARDTESALLCRYLCRNPAIPAGLGLYSAVSLGHSQVAENLRQVGMNTTDLYHSRFFGAVPSEAESGFGVGEVASSNLVVPTILFNYLAIANVPRGSNRGATRGQ